MKDRKLLRSIGQIDDNLILEAECTRFVPHKRNFFLKLAACLVLMCCLALVIAVPRFLSKDAPDTALSDPIVPPQEPTDFSFGGLSAELSQEQVLNLLGEPTQIIEDDYPRWFYPSLTVQFRQLDNMPCRIWLLKGCDLTMPNGIKVGSSEEDLQEAFPDALTMQNYPKTVYLQDAFEGDIEDYADDPFDTLYQINTEEQTLQIGVHDSVVEFMYLYSNLPSSQEEPSVDTDMADLMFGDLALDITQEQVRKLLGEPTEIIEEETTRWFYPTHVIRFHSFDQTVSSIGILTGCELKMTNGIGLGSTAEEVQNAFPDAHINTNYSEHTADTAYEVYSGSKTLIIGTADGEVVYMNLTCHEDPMLEALTVPTIIIYTPVDAGRSWESVTVGGKAAKGICTVLTISEPEEASVEKTDFIHWLDFGNGTALCLYGNDSASIYSYSGETFDPSRTDGLTWRLNGRFLDLDDYVTRAITPSS